MDDYERVGLLVKILLDINARIDERDDAAMDLGDYDDDRGLNALIAIATNPSEELFIMDACGASIAEILVRRNEFRKDVIKRLYGPAKHEAEAYIRNTKPEWKLD